MGNFKKQNFDARGDVVVFGATAVRFRASQPDGLGCSEVTKSAVPPHEKERPAVQASQSF